ncbi:MAG: hypothetical protein K6G81_01890 [Lachnospiraceae bacterium]|nr:hypothetical protein [Lachnospiraceae bacterium]
MEGEIIDVKRFSSGDIAFIISNNKYVSEVTGVKATGSFDSSELFNVEKKIGRWIHKIPK